MPDNTQLSSGNGLLSRLSSELAEVVQRVGPAVVRIDDGSRLPASGVIWSEEGVIVATSHGVERDEELFVEMHDGSRQSAVVVGRDPDTDLAALRVEATGLPAIPRAGLEDMKVGHLALALGRPGEGGLQATIGLISAKLETESNGTVGCILYTDAVLYPGFSGGPLVDVEGRMTGLNNLMFGRGRGVAVGTPVVEQVVNTLLTQGRIRRGYLGIRSQPVFLPEALRNSLGLEQKTAVLIVQVDAGTPADAAGMMLGDTLLAIDGQSVEDVDDLRRRLYGLSAGQAITLRLLRAGSVQEVAVTLGAQD